MESGRPVASRRHQHPALLFVVVLLLGALSACKSVEVEATSVSVNPTLTASPIAPTPLPASPTPLPNTREFVRGVINLRGTIVPIFDLRARFGDGQTSPTKNHVVVVMSVGDKWVGILVDAVSELSPAFHQG